MIWDDVRLVFVMVGDMRSKTDNRKECFDECILMMNIVETLFDGEDGV